MNNISTQPISATSFLLGLLIGILAFYSAWTNLVRRQITTFGPDAFLVFLGHLILKKRTEELRKDPKLPTRSGIVMILLGLSCLQLVVTYLMQ